MINRRIRGGVSFKNQGQSYKLCMQGEAETWHAVEWRSLERGVTTRVAKSSQVQAMRPDRMK
ncbi:hypothetical protein BDZ94DRAFT_1243475 [Collybia nuda]|uniref:Uncharacterized protein n=1 Tax=Collybia nuda TaxID=64659 RepID=A0A9P6CQ55_9AGAR|nr:hypothetical protein BDZ94DRAFT_1243475 [Collybia nuda]